MYVQKSLSKQSPKGILLLTNDKEYVRRRRKDPLRIIYPVSCRNQETLDNAENPVPQCRAIQLSVFAIKEMYAACCR